MWDVFGSRCQYLGISVTVTLSRSQIPKDVERWHRLDKGGVQVCCVCLWEVTMSS
jgi:hypothetical protein